MVMSNPEFSDSKPLVNYWMLLGLLDTTSGKKLYREQSIINMFIAMLWAAVKQHVRKLQVFRSMAAVDFSCWNRLRGTI